MNLLSKAPQLEASMLKQSRNRKAGRCRCGTKRAWKADNSENAKCVICYEDDSSHPYSFCTLKTDRNLRRTASDLQDYA